MDNTSLAVYIHELRNLTNHTQTGFDLFNQALNNNQSQGVLYAGQLILTTTSQMASLLWPARARSRTRGEKLRKVLGLQEKHPFNDRRLSELWERGDEKLEEWIAANKNDRMMIDYIGDPYATVQAGEPQLNEAGIFRAYNPNNQVYYFRGVPYNLSALAGTINDLANRIMNVYAQMFPEQAKREAEQRKAQQEAAAAQEGGATAQQSTQPNQATEMAQPSTAAVPKGADAGDAEKPAAEETPAKKTPAKKTPAKKPAAKKAPAQPAAKAADSKTAAAKPAAKKAPAKKATAKKPAAKKAAAKKADS